MSEPPEPYPAPVTCRVDVEAYHGTTRVALSGEIDLSTVAMVEYKIESGLGQFETTRLLLDLRDLAFMDSSGLRLLMQLRRDAETNGYDLTIVRPPATVYRPIEIAGLGTLLHFVDDPDEVTGG
jgi:anti-anti-sigma factor